MKKKKSTKTPRSLRMIEESLKVIRRKIKKPPRVGIVLGSGLGLIADRIQNPVSIPYGKIPNFYETTIAGHQGRLVSGTLNGVPVVVLQGRFHYYEGHSMEEVVLPARVLCSLGVKLLILTNAAGGVNPAHHPGDLMAIEDHINLTCSNPLWGPNIEKLGPRFPDLSEPYSKDCIRILKKTADLMGVTLHQGVYMGLMGPSYETPAEIRMFRGMGADAVGMSTVPETIAANHMGVKVAAISLITNLGAGLSAEKLTHQEVLEISAQSGKRLGEMIEKALPELDRWLQSGGQS